MHHYNHPMIWNLNDLSVISHRKFVSSSTFICNIPSFEALYSFCLLKVATNGKLRNPPGVSNRINKTNNVQTSPRSFSFRSAQLYTNQNIAQVRLRQGRVFGLALWQFSLNNYPVSRRSLHPGPRGQGTDPMRDKGTLSLLKLRKVTWKVNKD